MFETTVTFGERFMWIGTQNDPGVGGGGTLNIYWWGCAAAPPKRGVLGTGTTQKRGVLGTGTTQKRGVLRTSTSRKRGVLRTGLVKKTILVTDVAQKGVLGAYLLITLTFFLSTWSFGGDLLWPTKKEGSGKKGGS